MHAPKVAFAVVAVAAAGAGGAVDGVALEQLREDLVRVGVRIRVGVRVKVGVGVGVRVSSRSCERTWCCTFQKASCSALGLG